MELSPSAQEVIMQAQMLKLETEAEFLGLEHIYYGLLLMACYKEEPLNDPAIRPEARKLRSYLEKYVRSIASAKKQLLADAREDSSGFADAREALGRAAEMAGENAITPLDLAKAILEAHSPTVMALNGLIIPGELSGDDLYHPKKAQERDQAAKVNQKVNAGEISGVGTVPAVPQKPAPQTPAQKPVQKAPVQKPPIQKPIQQAPAQKPIQKPAPQAPAQKPAAKRDDDGMNYSQIVQAIQALDQLNGRQGNGKNKQQNRNAGRNRRKRKTRFGWITWRGGAAAAGIQYFLCALLIPAGILYALEHFTGWVKNPPTVWAGFGIQLFFLLWAMMLVRGLLIILGQATRSLTLFLRSLTDLAAIAGVMHLTGHFFYGTSILDPGFPQWIKIVGGVLAVLILSASATLYERLAYSPEKARKTIEYAGRKGRPGKVLFQGVTMQMLLPLSVAVGVWAYRGTMEDWHIKVLWIGGLLIAWEFPGTLLGCIACVTNAGWYRGGGGSFFRFLQIFWSFLFVTALVFLLHWLFGWFPMQLWVMITLGVYTAASLIISIVFARR